MWKAGQEIDEFFRAMGGSEGEDVPRLEVATIVLQGVEPCRKSAWPSARMEIAFIYYVIALTVNPYMELVPRSKTSGWKSRRKGKIWKKQWEKT